MSSTSVKIPVLLPLSLDIPFDYVHSQELAPGTLVKVSFRKAELYGVVWDAPTSPSSRPLTYKPILKVCEPLKLLQVSLKFIEWVSNYTLAPKGLILKMVLPLPEALEEEASPKVLVAKDPCKPNLSPEQKEAADLLKSALEAKTFQPFLLEGVTGSGKTEVYFEAIDCVLEKGGQALVLLPEISLSTQWLQRFEERFGFPPAIWHSDLPPKQRKETLRALIQGNVRVLVGTRSALFLPLLNLALIIVDEEHDGSYKQEEGVIYNARDMALVRSRLSHALCILVSATPSLETEANVQNGKYKYLHLASRYGGAVMPDVKLIDMRKCKLPAQSWISPPLRAALKETLERQEQAMLFLNRRGYAPLTLCKDCGERVMCPQCSISLVNHKSLKTLLCHHCGYTTPQPRICPTCYIEDGFTLVGPGVERILEEVTTFLPEARCAVLTSDHLTTPKKTKECIQKIQNHEVDVLIGTQIMAKGHHFPLLTLVGIIDGDSSLSGSDLRASEKAFQLLHQVSGRSGRESKRGHVLLQTYFPEHPLMEALVSQNREQFFSLETEQRQLHGFPPFGRLVALILSGKDNDEVERGARRLAKTFPLIEEVELLGPSPAPLSYLRSRYRWRLLLKTPKDFSPQSLLKYWISRTPLPSTLKVQIDIDPYSFF